MKATVLAIAAAALAGVAAIGLPRADAADAAGKPGMHHRHRAVHAPMDGNAKTVTVRRLRADGTGRAIGTITFRDANGGLLVEPRLRGLKPGEHGIHIHANADCGPGMADGHKAAGMAAGGHLDPAHTGKHLGPYDGNGHLGDLPVLVVGPKGRAHQPMFAPRLKLADVVGHAVMIHAGGDNYRDRPKPLGGGGARVACGVIR